MTTLGGLTPKSERDKPLVDGLRDCYCIQVEAEEEWDKVGVMFVGKTPCMRFWLDQIEVDYFIKLLQKAKKMMKRKG